MEKQRSNRFRRAVKIKREEEISLLFRYGQPWECPTFKIYYLKNGLKYNRYAIIVSKRTGTAVERNRLKRVVRWLLGKTHDISPSQSHYNILINFRTNSAALKTLELKGTLEKWRASLKK